MNNIQHLIPVDYLDKVILKTAKSNWWGMSALVPNLLSESVKSAVIFLKNRDHPMQSRLLCSLFLVTRPLELPLKIIWIAGCTLFAPPIVAMLYASSYHNWVKTKTGWSSAASLALTIPSFPFIAFPAAVVGAGVNFTYLTVTALTRAVVLPLIEFSAGLCSPDTLYNFYAYVDNDRPRSIIQHIAHRCFGGNKGYKNYIKGYMPTLLRDHLADVFNIERESKIDDKNIIIKDIDTKDHLIDALLAKGIEMDCWTHTHPLFFDQLEEMTLSFYAYNISTSEKVKISCPIHLAAYRIASCNICPEWSIAFRRGGRTDEEMKTGLSKLFSGSSVDLKNSEGETVTWALNPTMQNKLHAQITNTGDNSKPHFLDIGFAFQ